MKTETSKKYYINRRGQGYHETVDEFDTREEAREMVREYRMADPSGSYLVSMTPRPGWED